MKNALWSLAILAFVCFTGFAQQSKTIERRISTKPAQKIELKNFSATDIDFKSWDKNEVYINVKIEFESSNREYEEEYIKTIDIAQEQTDAALLLTIKRPKERSNFSWSNFFKLRFNTYNSGTITGEIYLPRTNALDLEANYSKVSLDEMKGDLSLSGKSSTFRLNGCGAVHTIDNDYGTSTIDQCSGDLHMRSTSGKVTVEQFNGPVTVDADYTTIKIADIKGGTTITSKSATVTAERIVGDLNIDADYSNITVNDVKGFVTIEDQSGRVRARFVEGIKVHAPYTSIEINNVNAKSGKPITITGQSGRLELEEATGNVSIDDSYSPLVLKSIRGNVDIRTKSSEVTLRDVVGSLDAIAEYSSFDIENLDADHVVMTNKSNRIELDLKRSPSRIDIRNEYGDVRLHVPKNYSGELKLKVSYGKIKSDFPLKIEDLGEGAYFVGKLRDGKNSMAVSTTSGNIYLETGKQDE